ncbi:hypothetical protein [Pseudoclavibacter endophyticus]|uniref:Uncharacterized protein n=1 Tax=Pseudoclavibacter endophyticus TaxID=1778590 RepID=A0A6H9WW48_9MICO|nr:hypothetical protein [Pseudoclavibacter endophyticus]KAB1650400.1 hypothetical protein F8O04_09580 [Pseudoclavibacter endophyticus]
MSDNAITLTLSGKISYEDEITAPQAAQIITFLNAAEGSEPTLGPAPGGGAEGGRPSAGARTRQQGGQAVASAREALDLSGAKTNPEKIIALAEYVLQDGGETFKVEDVKAQFRRARETPPGNFSRDLSAAVQAGWIAQGDGEEYYVTNKIQGIFDGDFKFPKSGNGTRTRASSKGTKAKTPEAFAAVDEFPTKLDGFPPYSKMKQNKDRLLWALEIAKVNDVKALTNKEIDWLTDHLGNGVPNKQITAAFNAAKRSNYANRSTQDKKIRITPDGEAYLKTVGASES